MASVFHQRKTCAPAYGGNFVLCLGSRCGPWTMAPAAISRSGAKSAIHAGVGMAHRYAQAVVPLGKGPHHISAKEARPAEDGDESTDIHRLRFPRCRAPGSMAALLCRIVFLLGSRPESPARRGADKDAREGSRSTLSHRLDAFAQLGAQKRRARMKPCFTTG